MYSGSMIGCGALVFAVWGYVIANQKPDEEVGAQVEINPKLLAAIFGEKIEDVQTALTFLCEPDKESRSKGEEGRRLIKIGQFDYRVVNGPKYLAIRDEEARREYNRLAKRDERERERERAARKKKGKPLPGEMAHEKALENGADQATLDKLSEPTTEQK